MDSRSSGASTRDRARQDWFRTLYTQCPLPYQSLDENGCLLDVNPRWLQILGYAREEVLGRWFGDFLPEFERGPFREGFERYKVVGEVHAVRFVLIHKAGGCIATEFEGRVGYDDQGRFQQTHCVFRDISKPSQAQETLCADQRILEAVFRCVPTMMLVVDRESRVCRANQAFLEAGARSVDGIAGLRIGEALGCLHTSDDPEGCGFGPACARCPVRAIVNETLAAGRNHRRTETRMPVMVGERVEERVLQLSTARVHTSDSTLALVYIEDVSEHQRFESRIKEREAALFHAGRLGTLGEMASGIAHELNQPLSAILNYGDASLQLLRAEPPDVPRITQNLWEIVSQGERAGVIIRRMRALAKGRQPRFASTDLNEVVHNAVTLIQWELTQHGVTLNLELTEPLPPVYADEIQIEQVLLNLIRNAIDAMRGVTGEPRLLTLRTAASEARCVRVEVCDTGVGLPQGGTDLLFEPFFSTKPDGLGIGLSISRTIIETHEGILAARPNPNRGAAFFFTLPILQSATS
ncbi:MAG: PAS domain S-box protein [Phycisphaerales bacterium]